ncbi:hypothetical protein KJ564_14750, partial [bacterium]|nr:hypothetical protein [bacterium]
MLHYATHSSNPRLSLESGQNPTESAPLALSCRTTIRHPEQNFDNTRSLRGSEPITSANDEAIFAPNRGSNPPLPPLSKGGKTQHPPYQGGRL